MSVHVWTQPKVSDSLEFLQVTSCKLLTISCICDCSLLGRRLPVTGYQVPCKCMCLRIHCGGFLLLALFSLDWKGCCAFVANLWLCRLRLKKRGAFVGLRNWSSCALLINLHLFLGTDKHTHTQHTHMYPFFISLSPHECFKKKVSFHNTCIVKQCWRENHCFLRWKLLTPIFWVVRLSQKQVSALKTTV